MHTLTLVNSFFNWKFDGFFITTYKNLSNYNSPHFLIKNIYSVLWCVGKMSGFGRWNGVLVQSSWAKGAHRKKTCILSGGGGGNVSDKSALIKKCLECSETKEFGEVLARLSVKNVDTFPNIFLNIEMFFCNQNFFHSKSSFSGLSCFKIYIYIYLNLVKTTYIKSLCPLTGMGGGVKAFAYASAKNASISLTCSLLGRTINNKNIQESKI